MPINDILVMDANGVQCPNGVAGEVWMRGCNGNASDILLKVFESLTMRSYSYEMLLGRSRYVIKVSVKFADSDYISSRN